MITNPYRNTISLSAPDPLHWWNLDGADSIITDNNISTSTEFPDYGTDAWPNLTGSSRIALAEGPGGQNVIDYWNGTNIHLTLPNRTWGGQDYTNISVSYWIKSRSAGISSNKYFISWGPVTGGLLNANQVNSTPDRFGFVMSDREGDRTDIAHHGPFFGENIWYHVVHTWDGTNLIKYLNNVVQSTEQFPSFGLIHNTAHDFYIGRYSQILGSDTHPLLMDFGMFGIFDVVLTADDISALYNGGSGLQYNGSTWS